MRYIEEPFDNIFYEDDIIETKLTEKDEENLEKIREMIKSVDYIDEVNDGIYCTIKDYYEDAIERGFRFVKGFILMDDIHLTFKTTEHNQTSLFWNQTDCEKIKYNMNIIIEYFGENGYCISYDEIDMKNAVTLISYDIDINKSNNSIKYFINRGIDKKEMDAIVKNIKFNFNIK